MPKLIIEVDMPPGRTLLQGVDLAKTVALAFSHAVQDVRVPAEPKQHQSWVEEKGVLLVVEGGDADAQPSGPIDQRRVNVRIAFSPAVFDDSNWGSTYLGAEKQNCRAYSVSDKGECHRIE